MTREWKLPCRTPIPARLWEERWNALALLQEAKKYLWDGDGYPTVPVSKTQFICHAIKDARDALDSNDFWTLFRVEGQLINLIEHRLQTDLDGTIRPGRYSFTLWDWVEDTQTGEDGSLPSSIASAERQALRHKWLDSLIEEFSN